MSYAELAKRAGSPSAVRAAGSACARNLIAPIIPCHRVVKTGGNLGNYAYGLDVKEELLLFEGALKQSR
jgi:methylated-DNA-[protein]-cysteine S-methyltransferase